jgi:hypothetical protein
MSNPTRIQSVHISSKSVLTSDEERIIRAYRQLKDGEQRHILSYLEESALDPSSRRSVVPCLRIVGRGVA